jgi:hypothetical protein
MQLQHHHNNMFFDLPLCLLHLVPSISSKLVLEGVIDTGIWWCEQLELSRKLRYLGNCVLKRMCVTEGKVGGNEGLHEVFIGSIWVRHSKSVLS